MKNGQKMDGEPQKRRGIRVEADFANFVYTIINNKDIFLVDIDSKEPGGGAKVFLELTKIQKEKGLSGTIFLYSGSSSPNLFFLYMGMIPYEEDPVSKEMHPINEIETDYLNSFFPENVEKGKNAQRIIGKLQNNEPLSNEEKNILKYVLNEENKREEKPFLIDHTNIPDDELQKDLPRLLHLQNKKVSLLEGRCIPLILNDMRNSLEAKSERVVLESLGLTSFTMTETGSERLQQANINNTKFEAFKNFEHLNLPKYQRDELDDLNKQMLKSSKKPGLGQT